MNTSKVKKDYVFFKKGNRVGVLKTLWKEFGDLLGKEKFQLVKDGKGRFCKLARPFEIYEAKNELVFDCMIFSDGILLSVGTCSGLFNKAKITGCINADMTNAQVENVIATMIGHLKKDIAEVESKYQITI